MKFARHLLPFHDRRKNGPRDTEKQQTYEKLRSAERRVAGLEDALVQLQVVEDAARRGPA